MLFGLQFFLTYIPRLIITTRTVHRIQNRIIGFNTLLIGSNRRALDLFKDLESEGKSAGNKFVGFIKVHDKSKFILDKHLECLGNIDDLPRVIDEYKVEEIIIAIESSEHHQINSIIQKIDSKNLVIKVIPTLYDILTGSVRMTSLYSAPLIQISRDLLPEWQSNVKRLIDILFSTIAIIYFFLYTYSLLLVFCFHHLVPYYIIMKELVDMVSHLKFISFVPCLSILSKTDQHFQAKTTAESHLLGNLCVN